MTRPGPKRKYKNIVRTSLSTEQWRYDCVEIMKKFEPHISHSYIYNQGFDKVFQSMKPQGSRERSLVIERVRAEKRLELEELKQLLEKLDEICGGESVLSNNTNYENGVYSDGIGNRNEKKVLFDHTYYKEHGMIEVEDLEDQTRMWIPEEDFNPDYERKVKADGEPDE